MDLRGNEVRLQGKNTQEIPAKQIDFYNRENSRVFQVGLVHLVYFLETAILFLCVSNMAAANVNVCEYFVFNTSVCNSLQSTEHFLSF